MIGAHADPNRAIAYAQLADAMLTEHARDGELLERFRNYARPFFLGDALMRFVLERLHGFAVVVITNPTFEGHAGARAAALELTLARGRIDDGGGDTERHGS